MRHWVLNTLRIASGLLLASCSEHHGVSNPSIYGGSTSPQISLGDHLNPGSYNSVALVYKDRIVCSGALLEDHLMVTAGHCFKLDAKPEDFQIAFGADFSDKQKLQLRPALSLHVKFTPRDFTEQQEAYPFEDLALVRFGGEVFAGAKSLPIYRPTKPNFSESRDGAIAGYGKVSSVDEAPLTRLQSAVVPLSAYEDKGVGKGLVVVGKPGFDKSPCFGDSGGPLYVWEDGRWMLVGTTHGVHSFFTPEVNKNPFRPCESGQALYVSLADHLDWLNQFLETGVTANYEPAYEVDPPTLESFCRNAKLSLGSKRTLMHLAHILNAQDCQELAEGAMALSTIDLSRTTLQGIEPLRYLNHLEQLYLGTILEFNDSVFPPMSNLKALRISNFKGNSLQFVAGLSALRELSIEGADGRSALDDAANSLSHLPELRSLKLANLGLDRLGSLQASTELQEVELYGNRLGDLSSVAGNKKMQRIVASRNRVKELNGVIALAELRELILSQNLVEKLDAVKGLKQLNLLILSQNRLTEAQKKCPMIEEYPGEKCVF